MGKSGLRWVIVVRCLLSVRYFLVNVYSVTTDLSQLTYTRGIRYYVVAVVGVSENMTSETYVCVPYHVTRIVSRIISRIISRDMVSYHIISYHAEALGAHQRIISRVV